MCTTGDWDAALEQVSPESTWDQLEHFTPIRETPGWTCPTIRVHDGSVYHPVVHCHRRQRHRGANRRHHPLGTQGVRERLRCCLWLALHRMPPDGGHRCQRTNLVSIEHTDAAVCFRRTGGHPDDLVGMAAHPATAIWPRTMRKLRLRTRRASRLSGVRAPRGWHAGTDC